MAVLRKIFKHETPPDADPRTGEAKLRRPRKLAYGLGTDRISSVGQGQSSPALAESWFTVMSSPFWHRTMVNAAIVCYYG